MRKRFQYISFSSVVLITLMMSLLLPTAALADVGSTPPPTNAVATQPAPTNVAPTNAAPTNAVATQPAPTNTVAAQPAPTNVAPTNAAPTNAVATQPAPTNVAPTNAAPTNAVATQPAPTNVVPTSVAPTNAVVLQTPVVPTVVTTETPAGATQPADLTGVVAAIANANAVVIDANGNPIPLASQQAADVLSNGDPYVVRGGTTYRFLPVGGCGAFGGVSATCAESATPIQSAINFAVAGETVNVEAGTYNENISITKSITLFGAGTLATQGAGTNAPTIDGGAGTNPATITVNGSSPITVTIRNFNIANGGSGIDVLQNAVMTIDNNTISGYYKNGITFGPYSQPGSGGVSGTIRDNVITGAGPVGIGAAAQNGIQISESNTATIDGNIITGNNYTPSTWTATGILLYKAGNGVQVTNNTLGGTGNAVNQTNVSINASNNVTITNNTVSNSTLDNVDFDTVNGVTFTGNTVSNGGYDGVWLATAENVNLAGNIFTNNANGAAAAGDPHAGAIHLATGANPATITITNNNSFAGDKNGVSNESNLAGFVVATSNWWGCATGPGTAGCDTVYGNVTTAPFLTTDPFAAPPAGGGGGGLIPVTGGALPLNIVAVTGGELVTLNTTISTTLRLPSGNQVSIDPGAGTAASVTPNTEASLPGALPGGDTFASGMTVSVMNGGAAVGTLPAGKTMEVSFVAPPLPAGQTFSILYWNPALNGGLGGWVEVPATVTSDGHVVASVNFTGTFVLVTK